MVDLFYFFFIYTKIKLYVEVTIENAVNIFGDLVITINFIASPTVIYKICCKQFINVRTRFPIRVLLSSSP
jgi:hypothetical protein